MDQFDKLIKLLQTRASDGIDCTCFDFEHIDDKITIYLFGEVIFWFRYDIFANIWYAGYSPCTLPTNPRTLFLQIARPNNNILEYIRSGEESCDIQLNKFIQTKPYFSRFSNVLYYWRSGLHVKVGPYMVLSERSWLSAFFQDCDFKKEEEFIKRHVTLVDLITEHLPQPIAEEIIEEFGYIPIHKIKRTFVDQVDIYVNDVRVGSKDNLHTWFIRLMNYRTAAGLPQPPRNTIKGLAAIYRRANIEYKEKYPRVSLIHNLDISGNIDNYNIKMPFDADALENYLTQKNWPQ